MTDDLARLRQISAVMPEMIVGNSTPPETLAKFKDAGFVLKFEDQVDRERSLETGRRLAQTDPGAFGDWFDSTITAVGRPNAYAASLSSPPRIEEQAPADYLTGSFQVDRYSANPGADYYRQALPGGQFAYAAPEMFGSGPLPLITGSGVAPEILRWCPWVTRHSAAFTPSASHVLQIIEAGLSGDFDLERLNTSDGRDHLQAYFGRIAQWVTAPVPEAEPSDEEIARLWPDTQTPS